MNRKIYYWKLRGSEMQLGERTLIMGVLNITPDSFSDGGRFNDPDRAYARALELEEQGADIIDIGAESTKPGSHRITADEEWQRLVPVLKRLRGNLRAPLSLDTYKSEIAERALEYGVEIFNDPSGLTFDPNLAKVAANGNAGLILNHMRGQPETWAKLPPMQDPVGTIARELEATVSRARHAGVERGAHRDRSGAWVRQTEGTERGDSGPSEATGRAGLSDPGGAVAKIVSRPAFGERDAFRNRGGGDGCRFEWRSHRARSRCKEMHTVVQVAEEIARAAAPKPVPNADERRVARPHSRQGRISKRSSVRARPRPPIAEAAGDPADRRWLRCGRATGQ